MSIDTWTLLLFGTSISFVFFLTFAVYALHQKTHPGFVPWTFSILVQGLAFLPLILISRVPETFSVILPHTLIIISILLKLHGLRQFLGRPGGLPIFYLIVPVVLGMAAGYYYFFIPSIKMRILATSLSIAILSFIMAWELITPRQDKSAMFNTLGAFILLGNGLSLLQRSYEWIQNPASSIFTASNHDAIHILIAILATVAMNTLFLLMNSQKSNLALLTFNQKLTESENRFRTLARASFESIFLSKDGKILEANPNACELFGYSDAEFKGTSPSQYVHEKDRATVEANTLSAAEKLYEITALHHDGSTFPIEVQSRPTTYKGELARITAIRDITLRKRADEIRSEREQLYLALFQNNMSAMLLLDPESAMIVDANTAACGFYGFAKEQMLTLKMSDINILTENEILKEMKQAAEEKRQYFNFTHRLADGETREVEVFTGPITYRDTRLLCSIVHDISVRKRVEKEKEELITSLQQALKEIKTLRGILPICAHCRKIRNDEGSWSMLEHYVREHSEATFSHGICPDCVQKIYPELADEIANSLEK